MYIFIYIYIYIYISAGFLYLGIGGNPFTSQKFATSKLPHLEQFLPPPKVNSLPTK